MGKWLVTTVGIVGLLAVTASSQAADLGVRRASQPYIAPTPIVYYNPWSGFYVGVNGGFAAERFGGSSSPTVSTGDGLYGAQIGYNWLSGSWLYGIEGDLQAATGHVRTATGTCGGVACTVNARINGFGTIRGRLGTTFGSGTLAYVTGGAAFINSSASVSGLPGGFVTGNGNWKAGWTVGAGVEQQIWNRWTGKIEYLFISAEGPSLTSGGISPDVDPRAHLIRAGLNYHF